MGGGCAPPLTYMALLDGNVKQKNWKGAGRKHASHTLEASKFREELIRRVLIEKGPLIDALIKKGKEGDVKALSEILDRVLGRATQDIDITSGGQSFIIRPIYYNGDRSDNPEQISSPSIPAPAPEGDGQRDQAGDNGLAP